MENSKKQGWLLQTQFSKFKVLKYKLKLLKLQYQEQDLILWSAVI